jgi:hypothetical protein
MTAVLRAVINQEGPGLRFPRAQEPWWPSLGTAFSHHPHWGARTIGTMASRLSLVLWAFVCTTVLACSSCSSSQATSHDAGDSDGNRAGEAGQDASSRDAGLSLRNDSGECLACTDSAGNCILGNTNDHCGYGGSICTNCSQQPGTTCQLPVNAEQWLCWPVDAGVDSGCAGCIDGVGQCQAGTSLAACGTGGFKCIDCSGTCTPNIYGYWICEG